MDGERRVLQALVVEDEAIAAMAISQMIEDLGCHVVEVASRGEDAVRVAARTPLDFVVMDIRLKGEMNGLDAAIVLRTRHKLPIVFTSAYSAEELKTRGNLDSDDIHFLSKPVTEAELERIIAHLRRREALAEPGP